MDKVNAARRKRTQRDYTLGFLKDRAITGPEQAFVSDITYVESEEGIHHW